MKGNIRVSCIYKGEEGRKNDQVKDLIKKEAQRNRNAERWTNREWKKEKILYEDY